MADGVVVDNGALAQYTVATDDAGGSGHVQVVKLAQSGDGLATRIPADGDGLLVNLGVNNDVAVTSLIPGVAATSLGKAEDATHTTGDTGVMALAVRRDTPSTFASDEGDYTPLSVDALGRLVAAILAMPAAARDTDSLAASLLVGQVMQGSVGASTELPVKRVSMTIPSGSSDLEVIPAVGGKKIFVLGGTVTCGAVATTITIESDEATDRRMDKMEIAPNLGKIWSPTAMGWMETSVGAKLQATTSVGSAVELLLLYCETT